MQLGAKCITARAENATQKKVLETLGVSEILTLEEEVAKAVSQRLLNPGILDLLYLAGDHRIVEIRTPERFAGKTLQELKIRERFQCNIVAIKRPPQETESGDAVPGHLQIPSPDIELEADDTLIVLGLAKDIEQMTA